MITDVINEKEFTRQIALWTLKNDKAAILPSGGKEEYIDSFVLPDFEYTHTQSVANSKGEIITLLKSSIHLRDWETKNGKREASLTFYKVLKSSAVSPDCEPYTEGYIIVFSP